MCHSTPTAESCFKKHPIILWMLSSLWTAFEQFYWCIIEAFLEFIWSKLSSPLPEQRMHCSVSECVFLGVVNKYVSMLCDHILAAIFWPGITFWRPVLGPGSLFCALKLIPRAVEPTSQTLHIYWGPGARWRYKVVTMKMFIELWWWWQCHLITPPVLVAFREDAIPTFFVWSNQNWMKTKVFWLMCGRNPISVSSCHSFGFVSISMNEHSAIIIVIKSSSTRLA